MINPEDFYYIVDKIKNEDNRQDGYVKLLTLAPKFEGTPEQFERYLNKTLFLDAKNRYKKAKLKPKFEELKDAPTESRITEQIDAKLKIENLRHDMSPIHFEVLRLFHLEKLTAKEIYKYHPYLLLRNPKQVTNIVYKYKKRYEKQ